MSSNAESDAKYVHDMIDVIYTAWCLKNESVHCVVLGASSVDQLYENMQAIQVGHAYSHSVTS